MTQNNRKSFSKIPATILMILGAVLLLVAVSCRAVVTQPSETQAVESGNTAVPDSADAEDDAESSSGEGQGLVVESEPSNQCLSCHTDQQALMDTAGPMVVLESENSGEG